eukprot:CAMPEP_0172650406 /NCGR_PEP_ID=MMETSP1068-20121228/242278_1 /TAXON_ID=35684 /ORGANISM="Pseudopedinella elastica, Strain CCMP716" /LENGTH=136 /DNA_ID=CAMNT_0013464773 /DNA_START=729 /DNA_END=1139 /DNA_ORIENTATION=-
MPLALLMLVTGTLMFIHRDEYFDYLEDRAGSDETSTESLETWYNVLAAGFFVTALLQIFRCLASRKLLFFVKLDASELRAAFLEDSSEYARRQDDSKQEIRAKYDGIRETYRSKYATERIRATNGDEDEEKKSDLI